MSKRSETEVPGTQECGIDKPHSKVEMAFGRKFEGSIGVGAGVGVGVGIGEGAGLAVLDGELGAPAPVLLLPLLLTVVTFTSSRVSLYK
jgi:hypothetical protein